MVPKKLKMFGQQGDYASLVAPSEVAFAAHHIKRGNSGVEKEKICNSR